MTIESDLYRKCVGAMLINHQGHVFVGQRTDTAGPAWQMPQGGIEPGESPTEAVLRELEEETGTAKAEILAETERWIHYDLPREIAARLWDGKYRGQQQKWFLLRFTGTDSDFDLGDGPMAEFKEWKWLALEDLCASAVSFKSRLYEKVVIEFQDIVERHAQTERR